MIPELLPEGWSLGASHTVRLPAAVNVSKKLVKPINLNVYRNLHHFQLNYQKQAFSDIVKRLLKNIPRAEKIWIHYSICPARRGVHDTMNVGSVVDKYFCDTLVSAGIVEDDNKDHVVLSTFSFGAVSPMDGHVNATIYILERDVPMRVLLDQDDIQAALDAFVLSKGISGASGVELSVNGSGEVEAEVLLGDEKPKPTPAKGKGGRPKGSRNKPKEGSSEGSANASDDTAENGGDGADSGGGESPKESPEKGEDKPEEDKNRKPAGKNLFTEEDSPSSESNAQADSSQADSGSDGETKAKEEVTPAARSHSSLFDD